MDPLATEHDLTGKRVGKYTVVEEVGFGGMSVVYRAHDEVLHREVALKVLHPHLAKRAEARRRFQREARAVAKLRHPNIVEIYDFSGEDSRLAYIVTEFIHGPNLKDFIDAERGSFLPEIGAMITIQLGQALMHAHKLGVIHRDVKPENAMIRPDGVVKLMDFGIAQVRDAQKMTETGSLLGSPAHMAPEVIAGDEPDARADVFSLGTVLYFLATGELPFDGRNAASLLRAITEGRYLDPEMRDPRIGHKLGSVIRKSLVTDVDGRFQEVEELVAELRECIEAVGVTNVRDELRQFFAEPEAYSRAFEERLVSALEIGGRQAMEERKIARAVDYLNRILAIDEDHAGARKLLAQLDRRRRMIGYGVATLAIAVVIGLGFAVVAAFDRSSAGDDSDQVGRAIETAMIEVEEPVALAANESEAEMEVLIAVAQTGAVALAREVGQTTAARNLAVGVAEAATDWAEDVSLAVAAANEAEEPDEREDEVVVVPPEDEVAVVGPEFEQVPVFFHVSPPAVAIWVDGREYGPIGDLPHGEIRLTPGPHRVEYRHPMGAMEDVITTVEVPDQQSYDVRQGRLSWLPARLRVTADLPAHVLVDGEPAGPAGTTLAIPMEDHTRSIEVQVVPDGEFGTPHVREIQVTANDSETVDVLFNN